MRIINEVDSFILDFKKYRYLFHQFTGRYIRYHEYESTRRIVLTPKKKRPNISLSDFKAINHLFDEAHPYLHGHYIVHTLIQSDWAYRIGLISGDELDVIQQRWRSTC